MGIGPTKKVAWLPSKRIAQEYPKKKKQQEPKTKKGLSKEEMDLLHQAMFGRPKVKDAYQPLCEKSPKPKAAFKKISNQIEKKLENLKTLRSRGADRGVEEMVLKKLEYLYLLLAENSVDDVPVKTLENISLETTGLECRSQGTMFLEGISYIKKGEYNNSLKKLNAVSDSEIKKIREKTIAYLHYFRGLAQVKLGIIDKASKYLEMISKSNPALMNHPAFRILRGEIFKAKGKTSVFYDEIRQALKKDPNNAQARLELGKYYVKIMRWDLAVREFIRVKILCDENSKLFQEALKYLPGRKPN